MLVLFRGGPDQRKCLSRKTWIRNPWLACSLAIPPPSTVLPSTRIGWGRAGSALEELKRRPICLTGLDIDLCLPEQVDGWTNLQEQLDKRNFSLSRGFTITFILLASFIFLSMFVGVMIMHTEVRLPQRARGSPNVGEVSC